MTRLLAAAFLASAVVAGPAFAQQQAAPMDVSPPPGVADAQLAAANRGVPVAKLDPTQRATLSRVNTYFNALQQMTAKFVQVGPDGQRTTGTLWMDRPGKIRFQYDKPSPLEIIADGNSVVVRNRRLNTQDMYPLSQTPLRFLLQSKVDLLGDANVLGVFQEPELVSVILEEKRSIGGKAQLQLMFGGADYQLQQWTVTDAQGMETSVALSNVDTSAKPDPRIFRINRQGVARPPK
ncbi:outer membrane lipoprotein-sorting protein [Methylopila capsulata]|uniref:Outer membrane lipoprotein-sorting protein n=1 Tax=Methylopila capsulata TaxID=61654 RepID=A0A9W6MTR9_9HYPH|nr:outer-membrane lipoprotein carrier protein LolA [Methylopila capsulata]MBM7853386.1 outer membrane lipoprotein-sorting protein [Methylopila capsulata]GLK57401.1 outer-membrane lipoprotein carrier protein [Methylopila capsulata]